MNRYVRAIFTSYEEEISVLDSQQWEQDLPRSAEFRSDRRTKLKAEMIDVDLVRGSTFPKAKRRSGFASVVLQTVISVLLFPLQFKWWTDKTNLFVYNLGCVVHLLTLMNFWLYFQFDKGKEKGLEFTDQEIYFPVVLFCFLVFFKLYIHSSNDHDIKKKLFPNLTKPRRISSEELFTWDTHKKVILEDFEGFISNDANSDNESMNGHICSDCDNIDSPANATDFEESEKESLLSDVDLQENQVPRKMSKEKLRQAFRGKRDDSRDSNRSKSHSATVLKIGCTVWNNNDPYKIKLSALQIGAAIFDKSQELPESSLYAVAGVIFSLVMAVLPALLRFQQLQQLFQTLCGVNMVHQLVFLMKRLFGASPEPEEELIDVNPHFVVLFNLVVIRLILFSGFFFLLSVTERIFRKKFVIAKLFSHITSSRRSARSNIPHFRLYKVRNIKVWLCIRSLLRKLGPKRSIDLIVSVASMITLLSILYTCHQMLKEDEPLLDLIIGNIEILAFGTFVGFFLLRFIILSNSMNQKFWNPSVLLTEQINIYLRLEEKPHKKEPLVLANNVLKLTSDLIKELERPYNILGIGTNPLFYNLLKILALSAASGILSEILGFKMKLYKVKLT